MDSTSRRPPPVDGSEGIVAAFLAADHARLDALLERASSASDRIDWAAYVELRAGLLKHIGMEEKILFPTAQAAGGQPLPIAARLRLEHGALAALLVPTPTAAILHAVRTILATHNTREEGPDGVYETCERLVGADTPALVARLRAARDMPLHPNVDGPRIMEAARRALDRAGYGSLVI